MEIFNYKKQADILKNLSDLRIVSSLDVFDTTIKEQLFSKIVTKQSTLFLIEMYEYELHNRMDNTDNYINWQTVEKLHPPKDGRRILGAKWNKSLKLWEYAVIKWMDNTWKVLPTRDYRLSLIPTHWKSLDEPK